MATRRGIVCPVCEDEENLTQYVALLPYKDQQPNKYAVCVECYREQWKMKYGKNEEPPV